jgi:hypothetical protein
MLQRRLWIMMGGDNIVSPRETSRKSLKIICNLLQQIIQIIKVIHIQHHYRSMRLPFSAEISTSFSSCSSAPRAHPDCSSILSLSRLPSKQRATALSVSLRRSKCQVDFLLPIRLWTLASTVFPTASPALRRLRDRCSR